MDQAIGRRMQRLPQAGIAVPQGVYSDAAHKIEIPAAVLVDEVHAFSGDEPHRRALVDR